MGAGHVSQFRLGAGPKMTDSEDSDTNVQAPWRERHNYELNSNTVLRDAYRLLCVVIADCRIAEFADNGTDNLVSLRAPFFEVELVHTLIQLAVMNRTQLNHKEEPRSDCTDLSFKPIERKCGELTENGGANSEKKYLTIREACNKIIHAEKIVPVKKGGRPFLGDECTLILHGAKNQKKWQANLDILEFLRGTFDNFNPKKSN